MNFGTFLASEDGGIMIDWVALLGGSIILGIAVVYFIFANGVSPVVAMISETAAPILPTPQPQAPLF